MSNGFLMHTIRRVPKFMPAFFETTMYDWPTGLSVVSTGETQEESEAKAAQELALLFTCKGIRLEKPQHYAPWRY